MAEQTIRIGIVGLGTNCRERHVPGLLACQGVRITGVCNRRPESTAAAAREFDIPRTFASWEDLVASPDIDAVVIGTWPYLHCPITLAALEANKHVMTEARMAMNAREAREMLQASRRHPHLMAQVVPSPYGLVCGPVVIKLLADGFIGTLREVVVIGTGDRLADADRPFHWRQDASLSGVNMLALGILHETLIRWVPSPTRVLAQVQTFTKQRRSLDTGLMRPVETPDSVHLMTRIGDDAQGLYHLSGVTRFDPREEIRLYGSDGTLVCEFGAGERIFGARAGDESLVEIPIPKEMAGQWQVEEDFIEAIRRRREIEFTDFVSGVRYMEFTEAASISAQTGKAMEIPVVE